MRIGQFHTGKVRDDAASVRTHLTLPVPAHLIRLSLQLYITLTLTYQHVMFLSHRKLSS